MENMQDPQVLYHEILTTSFEKMKKYLSKKHKPIKDVIQKLSEQAKADRQLDADKYFEAYRLCIETKDAKLVEISLNNIYRLISNSFMTGNRRENNDDQQNINGVNGHETTFSPPRRTLMDSVIESICSCKHEKSESIQLVLIRTLLNIVIGLSCEAHGSSLKEILDALFPFTITKASKANETQVTAKAAIIQIVNIVFQRMEEYNNPQGDFKARRKSHAHKLTLTEKKNFDYNQNALSASALNKSRVSFLDVPQRLSLPSRQASMDKLQLPRSPELPPNNTFAAVIDQINLDDVEKGSPKAQEQPIDRYLSHLLKNMIDDVCIHNKKSAEIQNSQEESKENKQFLLDNIPLRLVPSSLNPDDPLYRDLRSVDLENEKGKHAGYFGWCFMCRDSADFYCKDTRIPVCSLECKTRHLDELDDLSKPPKIEDTSYAILCIYDAIQVFDYLCKQPGRDPGNDISAASLRNKTASLELVVLIMSNPGQTFLSIKEFGNIVKESLCDSILKNSISTEKSIFAYSLEIFTSLVNYFKETLKAEVGVFIENIFLQILESGNSSFNHRSLALQVLYKLASGPRTILEFYINYDCSINSTNLVERIIELLCKIAQGKYLRSEYSSLMMPGQEPYLKTTALESLVNLVNSLLQHTQDYNKAEKKNEETARIKKLVSMDVNDRDDDRDSSGDEENGNALDKDTDEGIEKQRILKRELAKAVLKFNFKIKQGMKAFAQLQVLNPEDAKSVAYFYMNTPNLSKEKLGEFFGEPDDLNIKVFTEYVELMDFTNLTLDDGLRVLLGYFILPGEGQKIDRIMQIFASKFVKDNPKSYNSASAAYTLSYLLIMLQTDAHSRNIKEKDRMKLPAFIRLARGINDGDDLPEDELTGYYERILETPLGIHTAAEKDVKKDKADHQGHGIKDKEKQFKLESVQMLVKGQELMKQRQDVNYHKVKNTDQIRPLFKEIIWSPVLAVFSTLLEKSEDPKIIQLCIDGFMNCILLTGLHNMDTERDTFVSSLAKFTNLTSLRDIKEKNALCLKAILNLASNHGHMLRMSWLFVLECISKVDYYLNYAQSHNNEINESPKMIRNDVTDQIEHSKSEVVKDIVDIHSVNCIFSRSNTYELEEIIDFITCLCKTSEEELKNPVGYSTYSLQKLVEVAHFNLDRVKFIWSQIWNITREHISYVAVNAPAEVGFFAVDSLKQLSLKFLIKDELASVEFQREFLRPFGKIFQKVDNPEIKELVLNCCFYIVSHIGKNLKSGWKSILDILALGAESDKKNLIQLSFSITENIIQEHLESIREVPSEFIILLIKFSKCRSEEISMKGLEHLKIMIVNIIQDVGHTRSLSNSLNTSGEILEVERKASVEQKPSVELSNGQSGTGIASQISESTWITLLTSLSTLCSDHRKKIRKEGTIILFGTLKTYGKDFNTDFWQLILSGVIKPLFDEIQYYFQSKTEEELLSYNDSCREIFSNMIDVYYIFYNKLACFTEDFIHILVHCIENPKGNLAKISINALKHFITECHSKFSEKEWSTMVKVCSEIVQNTMPYQLLEFQTGGKNSARDGRPKHIRDKSVSFTSEECLTQCIVQLLMIALIKDIADTYDQFLTDEQLLKILDILNSSYQFAKNFNEQIYLRFYLWKNGLMKDMDQLPGLLKQGKEALGAYILIFYKLFERKVNSQNPDKSEKEKYLDEFLSLGINLMNTISSKSSEYHKVLKEKAKDRNAVHSYTVDSPLRHQEEEGAFSEAALKESFKRQSEKIIILEIEKEIMHTRTIFSVVFLPKLAEISIAEIKPKIKEMVQHLIDVSFYCVPKALAVDDRSHQVSRIYAMNDESLVLIRTILNNYFESSFSNLEK